MSREPAAGEPVRLGAGAPPSDRNGAAGVSVGSAVLMDDQDERARAGLLFDAAWPGYR